MLTDPYSTQAQVASRGRMNFTRRDNGLNQYLTWSPMPAVYDDNWFQPSWVPPGNGVMMGDGYITASYNALNQSMAMGSMGLGSNFYWYWHDPLGRCVKRWLGDGNQVPTGPITYFYYDGWNLVQEGPNASTADRLYVHGGRVDEIVASKIGGQWYNHHYDARGHCLLLTDSSGTIRDQYDYDAFGMPYFYNAAGTSLGNSGGVGNRFLFTGREWIKDLRIYDYRHRMYQPELGRFLQPDPKQFEAGDYNLYRYCHNDPINKTDPTGLTGFDDGDLSDARSILPLQLQRAILAVMGGASFKCIADMAGGKIHAFSVAQGRESTQYYNNRNAGEAVRHITWVAEATREYDEKQAMAVANAHEFGEKDLKDSARDDFNNQLAPEIGRVSESPNDSAFMAKMAWEAGEAAQSKNDPRVPEKKW